MSRTPAILQDRIAGAGAQDPAPMADCDALWSLCLAIAGRRRQGLPPCRLAVGAAGHVGGTDSGQAAPGGQPEPLAGLDWNPARGWVPWGAWEPAAQDMFALYRPLLDLRNGRRYVIGHLGQSIDGRIATSAGDSCFINGPQNLTHMHRLRALCDAVLVGAATVVADNPQLTTRLVPGPHATRVVLDPSGRLTPSHRICCDERSPTLVVRYPGFAAGVCGAAEIIPAGRSEQGLDLEDLLDSLGARGLHAILVEGGGVTVSRFLEQRLLDRLQIAIAPVIIGSGRHGLQLPEVLALSDCLRPTCRQHPMGEDVLWDLDLHGE